jgi:hypothetical protein
MEENRGEIDACGIESDPREIQFARRKGFRIVEDYLDPNDLKNESQNIIETADIISMLNVIEHVKDPMTWIAMFRKHMKKNAFLIIETNRHPSLASFVNFTGPQYVYRHISPPVHLQIFSEKAFDMLINDSFEIVAKWGFGDGYADILTTMALNVNISKNKLYEDLMNISNSVQKEIDASGYSDLMLFIMKKVK